jgi:DNA-binding CsgD family transcriptional regulator
VSVPAVEVQRSHRRSAGLGSPQTMGGEPVHPELTPHERHVLDLLAQGVDGGTIAAKLGLTRKIVHADVQSIMQKLAVHSRLEAAAHHVRSDKDFGLRTALRKLSPRDREALLRWLLAAEEDREDIASQALKRREGGDALAEHIATLTTHPEQRERFTRVIREIDDEPP